ncbi:hypothetical protein GF359_09160, partial [candidate division WOR-3 bacterium]|nr:hypothetical protein [candidate division WOR-3 bacterium]MBD3365367.1 hypothetical protein [candidate division WOR-3 bacterium]
MKYNLFLSIILMATGLQIIEAQLIVEGMDSSYPAERDTFSTYGYTFGDIVIFSYGDSNFCNVLKTNGEIIWSDTLMVDDYALVPGLEPEVYQVQGSEKFSVLSGDPFNLGVGTWFAVDEKSRPLSTKLLSVGPKTFIGGQNRIVLFSYYDNTNIVFRDIQNDVLIWEGSLDSAQYLAYDTAVYKPIVFSVKANKPVSAGTFSGVVGTYVPAFNGTFVGRDFMTYCHALNNPPAPQDLNVVPWEDNAQVVVTNLDNPDDTIWKLSCGERGVVQCISAPENIAIYIHSDKDISVSQTPWCGYTSAGNSIPAYLVRGIDQDGLGLGLEFYVPLIRSGLVRDEDMSFIHIIAYEDNTQVKLNRIQRYGANEQSLWQGNLNRGDYYRKAATSNDAGHAIYHVTSSEPVSVIASHAGLQGSDFLPLWFALHPSVAVLPDQFEQTECLIPYPYDVRIENNGNSWDLINIKKTNTKYPEFTSALYDLLGNTLEDIDGDGQPDTDTLTQGELFELRAEVTPVDKLPFGYTDSCVISVVSMRDPEKSDTAYLVTTIREIEVDLDPDTVIVNAYPGENAVFDLEALHTSLYRPDTLNFDYTTTIPESQWPVELSEGGTPLTDDDGDGMVDIDSVPEGDPPVPVPMQVTVSI